MDLKEQAEAARIEAEGILQASNAIMFQYALPALSDRYLSGEDKSYGLGQTVVLAANVLLFFSSSAAVVLCSIIDAERADEDAAEGVSKQLADRLAGLRVAIQAMGEFDEQMTGKPGGDA